MYDNMFGEQVVICIEIELLHSPDASVRRTFTQTAVLGLARTSDFCLRDCFVTFVRSLGYVWRLRRDNVRAPPYISLERTRVTKQSRRQKSLVRSRP